MTRIGPVTGPALTRTAVMTPVPLGTTRPSCGLVTLTLDQVHVWAPVETSPNGVGETVQSRLELTGRLRSAPKVTVWPRAGATAVRARSTPMKPARRERMVSHLRVVLTTLTRRGGAGQPP